MRPARCGCSKKCWLLHTCSHFLPPTPGPHRRYLSEQHDATTIGVLLGAAACHRGSGDARVSKMLLLHVPAAHPDNFPDLELSPLVQASVGAFGVEV